MTEQRPVRERLRELAAPLTTEETEALREFAMLDTGLTKPATLRRLLATLDTLERRVRAAEGRLFVLTRLVKIAHDEMPERLNNHTRVNVNEAWAYADPFGGYSSGLTRDLEAEYEARSLISGTKEPTDG